MVEDEGGDGGLGVHHVALGQRDADLVGTEQTPECRLVGEVWTGRVAERHAQAVVARLQLVGDGKLGGIGKAPQRAQSGVQPLGERLGGLDRQRLQRVRAQVLAAILPGRCDVADAGAAGHREERDVVVDVLAHVVGQAQPLTGRLAREGEARDRLAAGAEQRERLARRPRAVPLINAVRPDQPLTRRLRLHALHHRAQLLGLGITLIQQPRDRSPQPEVLAVEHLEVQVREQKQISAGK